MKLTTYTPATNKSILSAMKKKGKARKLALEKISKNIGVKYATILSRGFALTSRRKVKAQDITGSMSGQKHLANVTSNQIRITYKSVSFDLVNKELVFTI